MAKTKKNHSGNLTKHETYHVWYHNLEEALDLTIEGLQIQLENQNTIIDYLNRQEKRMVEIDKAIERLESKP